jgi:BMFP domain-containing protein YqiC
MAKTPASELLSTLKSYFNQLSEGERSPSEVATALNEWARESAESVKAKIGEEVEATVLKMGFIKREEYEKLVARVEKLEGSSAPRKSSRLAKAATSAKKSAKATAKSAAKSGEKVSKKRVSK